jgi:peptidoglycan/LPS O-acetylase OafA/YrhL
MKKGPPHANEKLYGLDHLRALAIIVVFFYHYLSLSGGEPGWLPAGFGWTGVELFFVLSGFLISSQLFSQLKQEQKISFSTFFIKRFFRIVPAFLVTVALYFYFPFFREREALPPLWKFLTFTQNFGLDLASFGAFSHAWSLCVEEHFYILLPTVLFVLNASKLFKISKWLLIAFFVFGIVMRMYSFHNLYLPKIHIRNAWVYWYQYIYYPTYNRLDGLLTGVSIAAIYQFLPLTWNRLSKYGNLCIVVSAIILIGAYYLFEEEQSLAASVFGFPMIAAGYGFLVLGGVSPTSFLYKWKSGVTTFIATISYGLYLTHKGIIHLSHELLNKQQLNNNLILIISIAACVLFAYGLNLVVEKPFMRLREKILKS